MAKETNSKLKKPAKRVKVDQKIVKNKALKSESEKLAVVRVKGRQYLVKTGEEILIDKSDIKDINFEVLLLIDGDKVTVGKPTVEKANILFKVLVEEEKGKKIKIFKYKSKSRYRKRMGFRPKYTRILIQNIS